MDMGSLMIKPVQRVMKYPLLLCELLNSTPVSHPDHKALQEALSTMKNINVNINELKRRKDLGKEKKNSEFFCRFGLAVIREVSTPVIMPQQFLLVLLMLCNTLGFNKITDALMSLVLMQLCYLTKDADSWNMKMIKEYMSYPCSSSVMQLQTPIIIKMQR